MTHDGDDTTRKTDDDQASPDPTPATEPAPGSRPDAAAPPDHGPDLSSYPRPAVATDIVVFTIRDDALQVLLIRRGQGPFEGMWALPGGFVREHESLEATARRELEEETGVRDVYLEQLYTFGELDRDPRFRVISVVYYALINSLERDVRGGTDASDARWFPVDDLPQLAFDHGEIVAYAHQRLRYKLEYAPVAFQLLPRRFTLSDLQHVYERIVGRPLDKRNFRRKVQRLGFLRKTNEKRREGAHRPAQLYEFSEEAFEEAAEGGVIFQF